MPHTRDATARPAARPAAQPDPFAPVGDSVDTEPALPPHTLTQSAFLHLAPGLLSLLCYVLLAPLVMRWGFPAMFASFLTVPLVLVPAMLGYLALQAHRTTGRWEVAPVLAYRRRLTVTQYAAWGIGLVLWGALAYQAGAAIVTDDIVQRVFGWLPAWFINPAAFDDIVAMPTLQLVIFLGSMLLLIGLLAPWIEELYFRGHLLPRLARYGTMAPLLGTLLFTLYHFESPWENPARLLMVLPMVWATWHTRSLRLAVGVHVALNTLSALGLIVAVAAAR